MSEYNPKNLVTVYYDGKWYAGMVLSYSLGNYDVQITYKGKNIVVTVPPENIQGR